MKLVAFLLFCLIILTSWSFADSSKNTPTLEGALQQGMEKGRHTSHVAQTQLKEEQAASYLVDCGVLAPKDAVACVTMPEAEAFETYFRSSEAPVVTKLSKKLSRLTTENALLKGKMEGTQTPSTAGTTIKGGRTLYPYDENKIYEVHTAPLQMTVLQFEKGELPIAWDLSDTRWEVASGGDEHFGSLNHLTIKPKDTDLSSGLFITTDKRTYYLQLQTSSVHMPLVSWNYSKPLKAARAQAAKKPVQAKLPRVRKALPPKIQQGNYEVAPSNALWRPRHVYNDGKFTYLVLDPRVTATEIPAFWSKRGKAWSLSNTEVRGTSQHTIVVKELFSRGVLRLREQEVIITNRDLVPFKEKASFWKRLFS